MNFVKNIFGAVNTRYLVRAYIFSLAMLVYAIWFFAAQSELQVLHKTVLFGYALLSAALFPFAKLVWDELRDIIMGNNGITYYGLWAIGVSYVMKILINVLLWFFGIAIAPLGILYLWFKNRSSEVES